jgi:hypothetical protein
MKYPHYKFLNFDVIYDYKTVYWRLAFLGAPNSFCYSTDGIDEHSCLLEVGVVQLVFRVNFLATHFPLIKRVIWVIAWH